MVPGFGKQKLTIGSDPGCDIVLLSNGVAPQHAQIEHHGGGKLIFTNGQHGISSADGRALGPGEQLPFDFRTQFRVGDAGVPFEHPAISLSLMARGQQPAQVGRLVIGRDPVQTSLVMQHPSVSSLHATVAVDQQTITDHDSTSGTYVAGVRVPPRTATPLPAEGSIYLGPVPIQVSLLAQLAHATQGAPRGAAQPSRQMAAVQVQPATEGIHIVRPQQLAGMAAAASPAPAGATPMRKNKTVFGQLDFGDLGGVKTIGRTEGNDIVIPHPQVSSAHAQVEQISGQLYVTDRGSANGTYVRGQRIQAGQKVAIQSREKIYIGPMPLQLDISASGAVEVFQEEYGLERWAGRPLYDIEAWSLFLEVPDRDDRSKMKVLLENISFKALPGDMIALMGPSGAGKTTLLLALNGYLPPSEGLVRINGEDLYAIYDLLRGSIGYVPQDDLVHPELTVFEAVRYSAKFRLPPDYSSQEIDVRVMQTLTDLGLEGVADLQIGQPEKKILSGGQRKRVNIALELVTDPVILYLDEPTSGLAADDAAALIHLLHDLAKATGKTIIMTIHQPAKDEYEKFNQGLILGYGGVPMFFGPTKPDSYEFFSRWEGHGTAVVDNPRDMFAIITAREDPIYKQLLAQNPSTPRGVARQQAALLWKEEFFRDDNPTYQKMYSGRRAIGTEGGQQGVPARRVSTRGQFRLLLSRYFKTKWRDYSGTLIMLLQAPIIGGLLAAVFGGQEEESPAWCLGALQQLSTMVNEAKEGPTVDQGEVFKTLSTTQDHTGAIFFLVVAAIWFGTSNAAREIVRERAIYLRERMVNLGLLNYVMSKFVLLSMFCMLQCALLLSIVFFALGFQGGMEAFAWEYGALVATSLASVALGLMLSTLVTSSEAAMALTPIALIPQVVLGGLMVPATTIPTLRNLMYVIPARWGFEGAIRPERLAIQDESAWLISLGKGYTKTSDIHYIYNGKFQCAIAQMAGDCEGAGRCAFNGAWGFASYETVWLPFAVLGGMCVGVLLFILIILKRRDRI